MNPAALIVSKLGGTRKAAAILGRPPTTVQSWKNAGVIPARRQGDVIQKARAAGITIEPADFFARADTSVAA
ncbi:carph-isopro domain-containing protein [Roseomonas elaeocarpi]|uniref:Carph-isopro domain-containing protein n=1 Tax=Roseomonas elaeocarpi TaxID=907779 RepID=A0ABV6JZD2_9PROT